MSGDAQRAGLNSLDGIDRVNDLENGDPVRLLREGESSIGPATRSDDPRADEIVEDFRNVLGRNLGALRDCLGTREALAMIGEVHDGSEGIFGGAGEHASPLVELRIEIEDMASSPPGVSRAAALPDRLR